MSEQPEALRIAEWFEGGYGGCESQAAAELRRLYEEVNEQARLLGMSAERELALLARIDRLEKQLGEAVWNYGEKVRVNQELLEALKELLQDTQHVNHNCGDEAWCPVIKARAAIAKGEQA